MELSPDEREAAFQQFLERSTQYVAAIEAAGDEPWHAGDIQARRELFMRRYNRPSPPPGLSTDPVVIRGGSQANHHTQEIAA